MIGGKMISAQWEGSQIPIGCVNERQKKQQHENEVRMKMWDVEDMRDRKEAAWGREEMK